MKKSKYLLVIVLIFALVGCKNKQTKEKILDEFIEKTSFEDISLKDEKLRTHYHYLDNIINVTWSSDKPDVISEDGSIHPSIKDEIVIVNAIFTLDDKTLIRQYTFKVDANKEIFFKEFIDSLNLPLKTSSSLSLPKYKKYRDERIYLLWKSTTSNYVTDSGKIFLYKEDKNAKMNLTMSIDDIKYTYQYKFVVTGVQSDTLFKSIKIPNTTNKDIKLPTYTKVNSQTLDISWISDNTDIITNKGKVTRTDHDQDVSIRASISLNDKTFLKTYTIKVLKVGVSDIITNSFNDIDIPKIINSDISLPKNLKNGVTAIWKTNNTIIDNNGKINKAVNGTFNVTFTATLKKGDMTMEKTKTSKVFNTKHFIQDRTFDGTLTDLVLKDSSLMLAEGKLQGTYESKSIETVDFTSIVPSWSAVTSKSSTVELQISIKCCNKWSKYFSYGVWGKDLKNKMVDDKDGNVKLIDDEVKILNDKVAKAVKFKMILRKDNESSLSPVLKLISAALYIPNYSFNVDVSDLPSEVDYDVPCLYQHDVPKIGNSICSPTSCTMLLLHKGEDLSAYGKTPNEYFAHVVYDHGNKIFGNWVYNTVGMSIFGYKTYVKRFYSFEELMLNLVQFGPMAASIRGYTVNNVKSYKTNGHLLVVRGYRKEADGTYTVLINDPNVKGVKCEMKLSDFENVFRNVSYVIE